MAYFDLDKDHKIDFATLSQGVRDLLHMLSPAAGGTRKDGWLLPVKRERDPADGRWIVRYTLDATEPPAQDKASFNGPISRFTEDKIKELNYTIERLERKANVKFVEVDKKDPKAVADADISLFMADVKDQIVVSYQNTIVNQPVLDPYGRIIYYTPTTVLTPVNNVRPIYGWTTQYFEEGRPKKYVYIDNVYSMVGIIKHEVGGHAVAGLWDVTNIPGNTSTWEHSMMAYPVGKGGYDVRLDDERAWILIFGPAPARSYDMATQGIFDTYKPAGVLPEQTNTRIFVNSPDGKGVTVEHIAVAGSSVLEIHTERTERVVVKARQMLEGKETDHCIATMAQYDFKKGGPLVVEVTPEEYKAARIVAVKDGSGDYTDLFLADAKGVKHRLSTRSQLEIDIVDGSGKLIAHKSSKEAIDEKTKETAAAVKPKAEEKPKAIKASATSPETQPAHDYDVQLATLDTIRPPERLPLGNVAQRRRV